MTELQTLRIKKAKFDFKTFWSWVNLLFLINDALNEAHEYLDNHYKERAPGLNPSEA